MQRVTLDLELIINGNKVDRGQSQLIELEYEHDLSITIPKLDATHLNELLTEKEAVQKELQGLPIRDVTWFLAELALSWLDSKSKWRQFVLTHSPKLTGYHSSIIESDLDAIFGFLASPASLYEQVQSELGNEHIFEEWIPVQASYRKAFGMGLATHILAGNFPMASIYSVVRSIITRNVTLGKCPSRDPISVYAFVMSMIEKDPTHPVTRSVSLAYWDKEDPIARDALTASDVIVAWGNQQTIEHVNNLAPGVPSVLLGPRWSASVLDLVQADKSEAALRLAYEIGYYDQEACLSTQRAFVKGYDSTFQDHLVEQCKKFSESIPIVTENRDVLAHRSVAKLEAKFSGWEVIEAGDITIIIVDPEDMPLDHPLTRTLFIHPVQDLEQTGKYFNKHTQTVCVFPWSIAAEHRDTWCLRGVDRIADLGLSRHPTPGFTHDGMRWLNQMVRMVCVDKPLTKLYKHNRLNSSSMKEWLFDLPLEK